MRYDGHYPLPVRPPNSTKETTIGSDVPIIAEARTPGVRANASEPAGTRGSQDQGRDQTKVDGESDKHYKTSSDSSVSRTSQISCGKLFLKLQQHPTALPNTNPAIEQLISRQFEAAPRSSKTATKAQACATEVHSQCQDITRIDSADQDPDDLATQNLDFGGSSVMHECRNCSKRLLGKKDLCAGCSKINEDLEQDSNDVSVLQEELEIRFVGENIRQSTTHQPLNSTSGRRLSMRKRSLVDGDNLFATNSKRPKYTPILLPGSAVASATAHETDPAVHRLAQELKTAPSSFRKDASHGRGDYESPDMPNPDTPATEVSDETVVDLLNAETQKRLSPAFNKDTIRDTGTQTSTDEIQKLHHQLNMIKDALAKEKSCRVEKQREAEAKQKIALERLQVAQDQLKEERTQHQADRARLSDRRQEGEKKSGAVLLLQPRADAKRSINEAQTTETAAEEISEHQGSTMAKQITVLKAKGAIFEDYGDMMEIGHYIPSSSATTIPSSAAESQVSSQHDNMLRQPFTFNASEMMAQIAARPRKKQTFGKVLGNSKRPVAGEPHQELETRRSFAVLTVQEVVMDDDLQEVRKVVKKTFEDLFGLPESLEPCTSRTGNFRSNSSLCI